MTNAFVQRLESREMLSTTLTGVKLVGPVSAVNSIVLTFSGPLDPATSQNVLGYAFGRIPPGTTGSSGFNIGDLFFRKTGHETPDARKPQAVKGGKIQFSSAVLDTANDTVTLTSVAPFKAQNFARILRVRGVGAHAIDDAAGIPLGNGADQVDQWTLRQGKAISYTDGQGNKVNLKLHGPGKLYVFLRRGNDPDPTIFIDGVRASSSIAATVLNGKFSAVTDIAEVNGGQGIANALLNNPSFAVATTVP